jgi:site-specific DNA-methyltransferase (adenine-specific)
MSTKNWAKSYGLDYDWHEFKISLAIHADCFEWMGRIPKASVHAIVTDPPYGVKEYDFDQLEKRENGNGGIWRIPPSFDGNTRSPLPRFTALNESDRERLQRFFNEWAKLALRVLRPGGHIFLASNVYLSQLVFTAVADAGLEFRGQIIRLVRTLRGGDRPKNAEKEFPYVCSMARGCYEPWGIFRKPFEGTVAECLRKHQTSGLRRFPDGKPFCDIIESERTPKAEREIFDHPSLKPQSLMRQLVYAVLPLGEGIIVDPFMGSGSTLAAAEAMQLRCIGIERYSDYFEASKHAVPSLAALKIPLKHWRSKSTSFSPQKTTAQISMPLGVG